MANTHTLHAVATSLIALTFSGIAFAGAASIKLDSANIKRELALRPSQNYPDWISNEDCVKGDIFHFPVELSGQIGNTVEIWAGLQGTGQSDSVDCTLPASRSGDSAQCWKLFSSAIGKASTTLDVAARDIVGQHTPKEAQNGPGSGTIDDCKPQKQAGDAAVKLTLTFMIVDQFGQAIASTAWDTAIDIQGPPAPTQFSQKATGTTIQLTWQAPQIDASQSDAISAYALFCTPVLGSDQEKNAGKSVECSNKLIAGTLPDSIFSCGSTTASATTYAVQALESNTTYTTGVASKDPVGNEGPLSNISCATTEDIDAGSTGDASAEAASEAGNEAGEAGEADAADAAQAKDSGTDGDSATDGPIGSTNSQGALISCSYAHGSSPRIQGLWGLVLAAIAAARGRRRGR
jgi:hypothetical protein